MLNIFKCSQKYCKSVREGNLRTNKTKCTKFKLSGFYYETFCQLFSCLDLFNFVTNFEVVHHGIFCIIKRGYAAALDIFWEKVILYSLWHLCYGLLSRDAMSQILCLPSQLKIQLRDHAQIISTYLPDLEHLHQKRI